MPIFTPEDEEHICSLHTRRVIEDRKLFFDYFGDIAVDTIVDLIQKEKNSLIERIEANISTYSMRHERRIPLLNFRTFQQTSMKGKMKRRDLQNLYSIIGSPGTYYTSLSGMHIVDLAAIYRNTDFRQRVNEAIGSNMFQISLSSVIDHEEDHVREYQNTLYLVVHL